MNTRKNFIKMLASKEEARKTYLWLKEKMFSLNNKIYLQAKEQLNSLNIIKVVAIVVANCFLLTAVYGQAVVGLVENQMATEQYKQIFKDFMLPYSYGQITDANYAGSDRVIINIQDLHCHPQVQKNISNIIGIFDNKYGIKNIYLEGAYGEVSTKWLMVAKDEEIRKAVMDKLIETGILTGAEYYSALNNKPEIIKGLENKEVHFDNIKRFGGIIENQPIIAMHIDAIKGTVKKLQEANSY